MKRTIIFIFCATLLLCMPACQQADPPTPPQGTHAETGEPNTETETETDTDTNAVTTAASFDETKEPTSESETNRDSGIPADDSTEPSHSEGETESASDDAYCMAYRCYFSWEEFFTKWPITGMPTQLTGARETSLTIPVLKSDKYKLYRIQETVGMFRFWYIDVDADPDAYDWDEDFICVACYRDDLGYIPPTFDRSYPYRYNSKQWFFYENERYQHISFPTVEQTPNTPEEFYEILEFKIVEFPNNAVPSSDP